ncbi:MAG: AbrB/MazE/SpoVT family DNA-binding domain-containing protein [Acidobacteria bacterium]|nr:AbrB/MazE/SpoVT family DNA-binding domain-containing protein [Acidobacteriota bacterium]MYG74292.1 AbrB/MazE/SpoVT family DNA-binding domain-containing protein [Acidobacteriota bacterium]
MCPTIDSAGRLVIPKAIREAARLCPGTRVRFRLASGGVLIAPESPEPAPLSVTLERRGTMVVAVPEAPVPTLSSEDVSRTIDEIRERYTDTDLDPRPGPAATGTS